MAPFPSTWRPGRRGSPSDLHWPPLGVNLVVNFRPENWTAHRDFILSMTYEVYDGLPLVAKSINLRHAPPDSAGGEERGREEPGQRRAVPQRLRLHHGSPAAESVDSDDAGFMEAGEHTLAVESRNLGEGKVRVRVRTTKGWDVSGGKLGPNAVAGGSGLCLTDDNSSASGNAQAVYKMAHPTVSVTLAGWGARGGTAGTGAPPEAHGGVLLGLASRPSLPFTRQTLDYWLYWMLGPSGGVFMGQLGAAPARIADVHDSGTRFSLQVEDSGPHVGQVALFINGVAQAWLPAPGNSSQLHPVVETFG